MMSDKLGPDHFLSLDTTGKLGRNYLELDRVDEALPLLERAYQERDDFRMKTRHGTHLFHAYAKSEKNDEARELSKELSASMLEKSKEKST